jgi:uncharacterized protein YkwD
MNRPNPRRRWGTLVFLMAVAAVPAARPDAISVVQMLRAGGCGGILPITPPLWHDPALDRAAEQWADGHALERGAHGLRVNSADEALIQRLRRSSCREVAGSELRELGSYRRGADTWLVLEAGFPASSPAPAAPNLPPTATARTAPVRPPASASVPASPGPRAATPALATRALQLVNEARARGGHCGSQSFGPAPPLSLSGTLEGVAAGHASDMAVHDYFEHRDLSGQSPADRVRAAGYREKLVGENIAYGPQSVEEVVKGWLASPDHCENIMDPRFAQMGIGLAPGRVSRRGLFWVQLLAEPRA